MKLSNQVRTESSECPGGRSSDKFIALHSEVFLLRVGLDRIEFIAPDEGHAFLRGQEEAPMIVSRNPDRRQETPFFVEKIAG